MSPERFAEFGKNKSEKKRRKNWIPKPATHGHGGGAQPERPKGRQPNNRRNRPTSIGH